MSDPWSIDTVVSDLVEVGVGNVTDDEGDEVEDWQFEEFVDILGFFWYSKMTIFPS